MGKRKDKDIEKTPSNVIKLNRRNKESKEVDKPDVKDKVYIETVEDIELYTGEDKEGTDDDACSSIQQTISNIESSPQQEQDLITGADKKGRISVSAIIEALYNSSGMVTIAAKILKVSYPTLLKYIKANKRVQEELVSIQESILDKVESRLYRKINANDSAAIFFYLKCKGKGRGYVESVHNIPPPNVPITFKYQLVLPNTDQIAQLQQKQELKTIDITPTPQAIPNTTTDTTTTEDTITLKTKDKE